MSDPQRIDRDIVSMLVHAALTGMESVAEGTTIAEGVTAALDLARRMIVVGCKAGTTAEDRAHNVRSVRNALQQLLLDTVIVDGDTKVN